MKRVISLWLPKFATDRLCRLRQDWLDSPLALVDDAGGKLVLHAVNTVAEQAGIRTGMTLADARAILPDLQTSEADFEAENRALTQLSDWCGRFSPWTAPDEDGSGHAFGGGVKLQSYKDGGLCDVSTFTLKDGLSWKTGAGVRTDTDIKTYLGKRAQAGRVVMRGFPRSGRFGNYE